MRVKKSVLGEGGIIVESNGLAQRGFDAKKAALAIVLERDF